MNREAIDNWPPGMLPSVNPPPGLLRALAAAEETVREHRAALSEWARDTGHRRSQAWVEYHDSHGWPDRETDYKRRLRSSANRR